jgi:hypothetical protein
MNSPPHNTLYNEYIPVKIKKRKTTDSRNMELHIINLSGL